ncbi:MAG TPA: MFS transporter [Solirubrobacteraceae bacterium]|nr:MFS transporter [Solirubrobacteraceae bacterium]
MRSIRELWRAERRSRWFFAAHLQGSLGVGLGYVALMVFAYERIGSAWAATAVLLADLLPSMLLGAVVGAVADRTSHLGCAIAADLVRAAAIAGLLFADEVAAMLAFAVVLGMGNALFRPATSALLPALVSPERLTAGNALYGMSRDAGQLLGPACAAGVLLFTGPDALLVVNATTFIVSALLLSRLVGVGRPAEVSGGTLLSDTRAGIRAVMRDRMTRTLMCTSGAVVMVAGTMNVAELVLAQRELGTGSSGFALLVCAYGCGLVSGSLLGASDTDEDGLRRRYLLGLVLLGWGLVGSALAPVIGVAMATFALSGLGNGLFVVSDRVLLQRIVPERLHGRAFGLLDAVDSWGFGAALVAGGALASAYGGRTTFALAGVGTLLVWLTAARVLRRTRPVLRPALATGA